MAKDLDKFENAITTVLDNQYVDSVKTLSEYDVPTLLKKEPILPLQDMLGRDKYKNRFDRNGNYDPLLLQNEIKLLESQEGSNLWLQGERCQEITLKKTWKKLFDDNGEKYKSQDDYVNRALPFGKTKFYLCKRIYETFNFDAAVRLGSKLSLITNSILTQYTDQEIENIINNVEHLTYDDAAAYIKELGQSEYSVNDTDKTIESGEELETQDTDSESPDRDNELNSVPNNDTGVFEPVKIDFSATILPTRVTNGSVKISKKDEKFVKDKKFSVNIFLENEIEQKYVNYAIVELQNKIRRIVADQLSLPENSGDLIKYKQYLEKKSKKKGS